MAAPGAPVPPPTTAPGAPTISPISPVSRGTAPPAIVAPEIDAPLSRLIERPLGQPDMRGAPVPAPEQPINVPRTIQPPMPSRPDTSFREPMTVDRSTVGGDLRATGLQFQQIPPGARARGDIAAIETAQAELNRNRLIAQEALQQAEALEAELNNNLLGDDERRVVLDEIAALRQRAGRYMTSTPSEDAYLAGVAQDMTGRQADLGRELAVIGGLNRQIAEIPMNPAAQSLLDGNLGAFFEDPLGATRSITLRSLAPSAPSIVAAVVGQYIGGPGMAGALSGVAGGATEMSLSVANDVGTVMAEAGVDITDPEAIDAFIQANPEAFAGVVEDSLVRAGIISAGDALTAGVAGRVIQAVRNSSRMVRAAAVPGTALGIEVPGEGIFEAGAQLATTGEIQPGEVAAEMIGAGGQSSVQTLGQTIAEAMRATPQVTPPAQPVAPATQGSPVAPMTDSPVTPSQPTLDQRLTSQPVTQPLPLTPEQRVAVPQPPVQEQNVPAPEAPPTPDTAAPTEVEVPQDAPVVADEVEQLRAAMDEADRAATAASIRYNEVSPGFLAGEIDQETYLQVRQERDAAIRRWEEATAALQEAEDAVVPAPPSVDDSQPNLPGIMDDPAFASPVDEQPQLAAPQATPVEPLPPVATPAPQVGQTGMAAANAYAQQRAEEDVRENQARPIGEARGGTPAALVKWNSTGRGPFIGKNFVGHGQMIVVPGALPKFEQAVAKSALAPPDHIDAGAKRILEAAEKNRRPVEWQMLRQAKERGKRKGELTWGQQSVLGKVEGMDQWVGVNPMVYDFAQKNGLQIEVAGEREKDGAYAQLALVKDGEVVGSVAAMRPGKAEEIAAMQEALTARASQPTVTPSDTPVDPGPRDTGSTADMGDYGPKPGRRPPGKLSPGFLKFSFNNKPSVYNAAFRDAGVDPDAARQKPLEWQVNLLKRQIEARYGIKVEIGTRTVVRKNLLGRKVEAQKTDLQARKAIDQMLDAYQTLEMLAAVMGVPTKALALPIDGKPLTLSLTSTKKLRGALGMFSYGGGKRTIHMPGRSNSFAHEWGHALDHYLNAEVGRINVPEVLQKDDPSMLTRKAVRQGIMQPFSHKRPLTQAFAYMMQGLYGDRARLAQLQLQLQLEVAQIDANGEPTPKAKNAQKILRDMQQGKPPPANYLNEFYKSSAEYDQAVGAGGYFTDPAEMFARAFEAFVGREVARQTDAPQNFLSKGSWAYDDTNDQRAALTFPKGADAEGFAVGMSRLSQAMMQVSDLKAGEAPVFPKTPEKMSPMTIDRPSEAGNFLGAWYRREANSWGQLVDNIFQSVKSLRGEDDATRLEHRLSRLFMRHVINSGSGALHDIARNYDGKARAAIDNIAMKIGTRPGYGQVTNDIWQQEMEAYALSKLNYVQNEVKKVFPGGDIPEKHRRAMRHALLGKTEIDGKPIPPAVMGLARKLNQVTDRIWYDLDSTGHELGYQRGYLPFVYHLGKIDADPDGFKAQAKKVYSLMFTREVFDNADAEEQMKDVNRAIRQLSRDMVATPKGTKFEKSWLTEDDEILIANWRDAKKRVKDIQRKIAKEMEAQKPRADVLDKLRADLQAAGDKAEAMFQQVLNMLRDRWSDYSVEHWYVAQGVGRINDFDTMGPSANFLKGRRFPVEAADILEGYMVDDPLELMQGYIFGASRKIQYAKAFGAPTMTDDGEEIGADLKTMLQAARSAGVRAEDIDTIKTAVNAATGRMRGDVMGWIRTISRIGAYGQMALLTLAPLSSFAEPLTVGLRSGSARDSFKAIVSNLRNIVQSGRRGELYDLARFIGMVADYTAETVMSNRMAIDAMSLSEKDRARVAKFHQMTGLTPLTNFNRISNLPIADGIIRRLLVDAVRGERTLGNRARDAIAGGAGKFADAELNELGISQEDRAPLLEWLESLGGMPRQEDLLGPDGSMHEAARIWSRAVRRMTNETIQNTMKSDRAIAANSPFLATMYSIMSFIDGFHRNILLRNLRRGVSEDAGVLSWERMWKGGANVALMAMPAGMLFAGQFLVTVFREMALNSERLEEMDDDELVEFLLARAWSRTGLVGRFDPLIQIATGVKYENDLTGLVAGPYNSFFMGQLQTIFESVWGRNSANTNTTEWNAAQSLYRGLVQPLAAATVTSLFPAGGAAGLLGTSALYYLGRYDTSRQFADTLVGEKGTNYRKEGIEPPMWEMGNAKWRENDD